MSSIHALPADAHNGKGFYPTPEALANKLLDGVDWRKVGSVLEPSAGKGDLAKAVVHRMADEMGYQRGFRERNWSNTEDESAAYKYHYSKAPIDVIELDTNLRHILTATGFHVVHDDFLSFKAYKKYDLIVMNPPFDHGYQHLSHAIELLRRYGGQVCCILNAETIRNPFNYGRQKLMRVLDELDAQIDFLSEAFTDAERATDVDIVIIRAVVPANKTNSVILDALQREQELEVFDAQAEAIVHGDFLTAIVSRYEFEARAGLKLLDEYESMKPYILEQPAPEGGSGEPIMRLMIGHEYSRDTKRATANDYIQLLRLKYWKALFTDPRFTDSLTTNLVDDLRARVDDLRHYDFSLFNIRELQMQLSAKMVQGIDDTILTLFDKWTRVYSWSEYSGNKLQFDGWKTNDAYKVNKRVIHPLYGYDSAWGWGGYDPTNYRVKDVLGDIEKVFSYLDTRNTPTVNMSDALQAAKEAGQTRKVHLTYFDVTFYQKGTMHITFHDADILHKFNLFGSMRKGWLPPTYGMRRYEDMTQEEQHVVDGFEGKDSYERVVRENGFFLVQPKQMMLEGGVAA